MRNENGEIDHTELKEDANGICPGSSKTEHSSLKSSIKEGQKSDGTETAHSQSSNQSKKSKSSYDKLNLSRSNLKDMKLIGRGEFGEIFLAKLPKSAVTASEKRSSRVSSPSEEKETNVMVKSLNQTKEESCLLEFKREIDMFSKLSHEHVVRLCGLCRETEPHFLILEYTDWVSLRVIKLGGSLIGVFRVISSSSCWRPKRENRHL